MKYLTIILLLLTANCKAQTSMSDSAGRMIQTSARLRIGSMVAGALTYIVARAESKVQAGPIGTSISPTYSKTILIGIIALSLEIGSIGTLNESGKLIRKQ